MPNKVGRWFRWVVASFAAALGLRGVQARPRRQTARAGPARPRVRVGRVSKAQPPPLSSSNVPPSLPAGPAMPRSPTPALPGRQAPTKVVEPVPTDPFESLRRTAMESPERPPLQEEPQPPHPAPQPKAARGKPESAQNDGTVPCLATGIPTAILWILDDGQRTGQSVRMRKFPFLIGRSQGHVCIPHDADIEPLHLEISWRDLDSDPQILIRDLSTREGMFVRAVRARIRVGREIRLGSGRYRLSPSSVLEEVASKTDRVLPLEQADVWLGRIPECAPLHLGADPMVDRQHAKLSRRGDGDWRIEDNDSLNGTWIRMSQVVVRSRAEILVGEQVLVVDIPRHARTRR